MRSSIIRYVPRQKRFYCGDEIVSWQQLGRMMAWALLEKKTTTLLHFQEKSPGGGGRSWCVEVGLSYIQQMLSFAAEHGWFWDEVPEMIAVDKDMTCDHKFDRNNITPGRCWGLVTQLRATAEALEKDADWEAHYHHRDKAVQERARLMKAQAAALRGQADATLPVGVPMPNPVKKK